MQSEHTASDTHIHSTAELPLIRQEHTKQERLNPFEVFQWFFKKLKVSKPLLAFFFLLALHWESIHCYHILNTVCSSPWLNIVPRWILFSVCAHNTCTHDKRVITCWHPSMIFVQTHIPLICSPLIVGLFSAHKACCYKFQCQLTWKWEAVVKQHNYIRFNKFYRNFSALSCWQWTIQHLTWTLCTNNRRSHSVRGGKMKGKYQTCHHPS